MTRTKLVVRSGVKAGALLSNHNRARLRLVVRSNVKAGGISTSPGAPGH